MDQAERTELWDPGRVEGHWRKGIASCRCDEYREGWRAPDRVEEVSSGSSAVNSCAKGKKNGFGL